jgi:hypothetical protein
MLQAQEATFLSAVHANSYLYISTSLTPVQLRRGGARLHYEEL